MRHPGLAQMVTNPELFRVSDHLGEEGRADG
jgi:hypothetical protein